MFFDVSFLPFFMFRAVSFFLSSAIMGQGCCLTYNDDYRLYTQDTNMHLGHDPHSGSRSRRVRSRSRSESNSSSVCSTLTQNKFSRPQQHQQDDDNLMSNPLEVSFEADGAVAAPLPSWSHQPTSPLYPPTAVAHKSSSLNEATKETPATPNQSGSVTDVPRLQQRLNTTDTTTVTIHSNHAASYPSPRTAVWKRVVPLESERSVGGLSHVTKTHSSISHADSQHNSHHDGAGGGRSCHMSEFLPFSGSSASHPQVHLHPATLRSIAPPPPPPIRPIASASNGGGEWGGGTSTSVFQTSFDSRVWADEDLSGDEPSASMSELRRIQMHSSSMSASDPRPRLFTTERETTPLGSGTNWGVGTGGAPSSPLRRPSPQHKATTRMFVVGSHGSSSWAQSQSPASFALVTPQASW